MEVHHSIENAIAAQSSSWTVQGLSTSVYGLGMTSAPWHTLRPSTVSAIQDAVLRCFDEKHIVPQHNAQAIANIMYALGFSSVSWADFPAKVQDCLMNAAVHCGPHFKVQELGNLVYG